MRYVLRRLVLGEPRFIEITEHKFATLKSTQEKLLIVLNIEQTFDLFLENYAEFERELLGLSHRLLPFSEHGEPLGPHREMNRRMVNLLTSARLYVNQVPRDLDAIYGKYSKQAGTFCKSRMQQRASFAYRVMEALRNYAQHCGLPVHAIIHSLKREDTNPGFLLSAGLHLFVNPQHLKARGNLKKDDQKAVEELAARADRYGYVPLTPYVRKYMEKLCEVHESLRGRIAEDVASWDQAVLSKLDRARQVFGEDLSGLSVVKEES